MLGLSYIILIPLSLTTAEEEIKDIHKELVDINWKCLHVSFYSTACQMTEAANIKYVGALVLDQFLHAKLCPVVSDMEARQLLKSRPFSLKLSFSASNRFCAVPILATGISTTNY